MNYDEMSNRFSEYSAVRDRGAGLIDLSAGGRIIVSGSEAVMFLNGLITNDMKTLGGHSWMPAAFTNVQGRLLAVVRVLNLADHFLIDTERATHAKILELLGRFTLAGDFRVTDATEEIATLSVQGRGAADVIRTVFGDMLGNLERGPVAYDLAYERFLRLAGDSVGNRLGLVVPRPLGRADAMGKSEART